MANPLYPPLATAYFLALVILSLFCYPLHQAQAISNAQFQVQATITSGCAVLGSGNLFGTLNFGAYPGTQSGSVSGAFLQNSLLTLACTPGVVLTMQVNGGANYTTVRNVIHNGGSLKLPYRIYTDVAHTNEILPNQNVALNITSTNNNIPLPIYGFLQLNGISPTGSYTDTLTVVLTW